MTDPNHITPELNEKPEKKGFSKRQKLIATGSAALLGAGAAIFGVSAAKGGDGEQTEPTPTPSATPTETFEPSPTPSAEPSPEVTPTEMETMPESLEVYEKMSFEEFMEEPWENRMQYCSWYNRDIEEIAAKWYEVTGDPLDKYPSEISEDNTPQEKLIFINYTSIRSALVSHQNNEEIIPLETARKIIGCEQYNSGELEEDTLRVLQGLEISTRGLPPQAYANQNGVPNSLVIDFDEPVKNEGTIKQEATAVVEGRTHWGPIYTGTYIDYAGNERVGHAD